VRRRPPPSLRPLLSLTEPGSRELRQPFHQALRTNDLETFMSYVAEDVFFMPPGEPPVRGRDAVRKWMTGFLAQYRTSSLTLADREVLIVQRLGRGTGYVPVGASAGCRRFCRRRSRELHAGVERTGRQDLAVRARGLQQFGPACPGCCEVKYRFVSGTRPYGRMAA
jgi:SnoaL-like domain